MVIAPGIYLTGLLASPDRTAPSILQRTDQEFIPAIIDELQAEDELETLARSLAREKDSNNVLRLYQPVQRTFNVAVLESFCSTHTERCLNPNRIESTGLVIRRLALDGSDKPIPGRFDAWCSAGTQLRGWVRLPEDGHNQDPDPQRRPPALDGGVPEISRRLSLIYGVGEPLAESVAPLFKAPPGVGDALHRTVLFGLVPVTSSEISETPSSQTKPSPYYDPANRQRLTDHLHSFLREKAATTISRAGQLVSAAHAETADMQNFLTLLRQVSIELDAFGTSQESKALFQELQGITLDFYPAPSRPAGDFLREATRLLVELDAPASTLLRMPNGWPAISKSRAAAIFAATISCLNSRSELVKPREGRFDDPGRQYVVRGFIRVTGREGCPPELIWSAPSEPFTIAPWFESNSNTFPVQISLPDLSNREALKRLKPNVVFALPESLQNMLTANQAKKLADGEGQAPGGGGLGLDWLCAFSIPIITLCAFIVLNIFLQLFNIIFHWLLFIKICIPIPKRSS